MKKLLKIIDIIVITILVLLILLTITSFIKSKRSDNKRLQTVLGFSSSIVITGSMEPNIKPQDLIITKEKKKYSVDDRITFYQNNMNVTHRIIDIYDKDGVTYYVTKGDANNAQDDPIVFEDIIGKVIIKIPKFGYLKGYLQTPSGIISIMLIAALLIIVPELITRKKED